MTESRSAAHFERLYQSHPDPWNFSTSAYEHAKYRRTLSVLNQRHFTSGLEVGCSIGILTRMLAPYCDRLLGIDLVEDPLPAARSRCAGHPHVRFQRMGVPAEWPVQLFDLIVFSEVLYFLAPADIDRCAHHVHDTLLPNATVVLVNWVGPTDDPTSGEAAANCFIAATAGTLTIEHQEHHQAYRLDVLKGISRSR